MMFSIRPYRRRILDNIDRMLEAQFGDFWLDDFFSFPHGGIRVNIKEEEDKYVLEAELPGVDKDEIILKADDDTLTIAVKRDERIERKDENYLVRERRYGSMSRSFYFDDVDFNNVKAKFNNGILYVSLPKVESKRIRGKQIEIE